MEHIQAIQNAMEESRLDALLLTDPISCRYAAGFAYTDGAMLLSRTEAWLITDSRYTEAAAAKVREAEILEFRSDHPLTQVVGELLTARGWTPGAEESRMTHAE